MAEKVSPERELVVVVFVEIGGGAIGVREERARLAGAHEAETLTAAGEPRLEIAAEGIREEDPHVGELVTQFSEMEKIAEARRRERMVTVGNAPRLEERVEG